MPAAETTAMAATTAAAVAEELPSRLDSVLSFGAAVADPPAADARAFSSDAGSSDDDGDDFEFSFSFAFAPPLAPAGRGGLDLAPADDLFAGGRIVPAYPVFDRHLRDDATAAPAAAPRPDTYCEWAPRSAPGSPSRAAPAPGPAFPKSASAGEARRHWRLRDLVAGRSHSDGKEKFAFLQPPAAAPSKAATKPASAAPQQQKQGKKKSGAGKAGAATEMDMAAAHRRFYGKQQQGAGDRRPPQQQSFLPYRPAIVGFFATAHALGRSHHPY